MSIAEGCRWLLRLVIPTAMLGWGLFELYTLWQAGWIWHGFHSAIAFFVGLAGLGWLVEDLKELFCRMGSPTE